MIKWVIVLVTFLLIIISSVQAHPGNTASDGCHYCRTNCSSWGVPWNQKHCHNTYRPQPQINYTFPQMNAEWDLLPNDDGQTFDIGITLKDPNPSRYSVTLNKCAGCDPGPLVDWSDNHFYFKNISQGTWYMNIRKEIGGYWSNISYWTINVPEWYSPPAPTSVPIPTPQSFTNKHPVISVLGLYFGVIFGVGLTVVLIGKVIDWIKSKFT
jgi:hypothetical protein